MPITSEWLNEEKTIVYIKYDASWTLDDYYANFDAANKLIQSVNHPVVTILDFSTSGPLPMRFLTVGSHAERAGAKNNVQIIVFGMSGYMAVIARTFQRLFPKSTSQMQLVGSREAAIETAQATLQAEVSG